MTSPVLALRQAILAAVSPDAELAAVMGGTVRLYDEVAVVVAGRDHLVAATDPAEEVALADLDDDQLVLPHRSGWTPAAPQLHWPPMSEKDAVETVASLLADVRDGAVTPQHGPGELDAQLQSRGLHPLGMPAWHRIDAAEIERGVSHGRQRTTLSHRSELLAAADEH